MVGCCDGHPAALQPWQLIAVSENGVLWHATPLAHLEEKLQYNHCLNTALLFPLGILLFPEI